MRTSSAVIALVVVVGCRNAPPVFTEASKAAVADSAKAVLQTAMGNADKLDFSAYFQSLATDTTAKYAEAGALYPSFDDMKKGYMELGPQFESLAQAVDGWNLLVLSPDAVAFTLPFHFTLNLKGRPKFSSSGVWSGVVRRIDGRWLIAQSHESWQNQDKVIAALTPAPAKAPPAK